MISQVAGTIVRKELDLVEISTNSGLSYEVQIPLSTLDVLPEVGNSVSLHTSLVVKEDQWQLFGFATYFERRVFERLITANGVGPALAMGMLTTITADRLVTAIVEKDIPLLQSIPKIGRKKAERLILDLSDKIGLLRGISASDVERPASSASSNSDEAIRALISLGYSTADADKGVRSAIEDGFSGGTSDLIRAALSKISGKR